MAEGERQSETTEQIAEDKPLSKLDKRNLIVLLLSIFLWFFAFNAIETFGSLFGTSYLGQGTGCVRVSLHRAGPGQDRGVLHCGCPAAQASGAGRCAASERSLSPNLAPIL